MRTQNFVFSIHSLVKFAKWGSFDAFVSSDTSQKNIVSRIKSTETLSNTQEMKKKMNCGLIFVYFEV